MNYIVDANVPYISLFGNEHFFYFLSIIGLLTFILVNRTKLKKYRRLIRTSLISLSIFQQVLLYGWYWLIMDFNFSHALPLHLCRISTLIGIAYLILKKSILMDFVFYYGLFTYFSFLLPFSIYPPYHVMGVSYLINHAITLILPFIAWYTWGWKPKYSNLPYVIIGFLVYFNLILWVNDSVQGNYFYLVNRPFLKDLPTFAYNSLAILVTLVGFMLAYWLIHIFTNKKTIHRSISSFKLAQTKKYTFGRIKSYKKGLAL
jgi:hypothetical integral membrane protein (TIGR02206 family)